MFTEPLDTVSDSPTKPTFCVSLVELFTVREIFYKIFEHASHQSVKQESKFSLHKWEEQKQGSSFGGNYLEKLVLVFQKNIYKFWRVIR